MTTTELFQRTRGHEFMIGMLTAIAVRDGAEVAATVGVFFGQPLEVTLYAVRLATRPVGALRHLK